MIYSFALSMQLAVDVQIPDEFGGLNGEAIYIGRVIFFVYLSLFVSHFILFSAILSGYLVRIPGKQTMSHQSE